jgi:gamma-glutamyltranspeptidase
MQLAKIASFSLSVGVIAAAAQNVTHGAVAMEIAECSQIGADMLSMGGNAADAMIAGCLCVGTIASYHSYVFSKYD